MSNLIPYADIERMAKAMLGSRLFGMKNAEEAVALMLIAQAEGQHPAAAAKEYHIVQGRPALKADAMLARFQKAGGSVKWLTYTDQHVAATFSHPQGGTITIEWTFDQAKKIGLTSKDNWRNYPRAMLRSRVISEGVRTCFPGVATGTYTVEEVQDMATMPPQGGAVIDMPEMAPDAPPEKVRDAEAAAKNGMLSLRAFWEGLPKSDRQVLASRTESLREIAMSADAVAPGEDDQ